MFPRTDPPMNLTKHRALGAAAGVVLAATASAGLSAQGALGVDTTAFDRSVRPQDDFYQFVNGGWLRSTQIPADRATIGSFILLRDESESALRRIVEETAANRNRPAGSDAQKVGDLYQSFMDTAAIERAGIQPVQGELTRIRGLSSKSQLPAFFAANARRGIGSPVAFFVGPDQKSSTQYTVYVSQSGTGLPDRDYYLQEGERFQRIRDAYVAYMETLLNLAGEQDAAGKARSVLAFETEIAKRQWDRTRNRDRNATYNQMTVAQLRSAAPGFDWGAWINAAGVNVQNVVVRQPSYLPAVDSLLAATDLQTIKSYSTVRLLDATAPYLTRAFVDANFNFRGKALSGLQENRPRWKRGISVVEGTLGEMVGKMYVERHFRPEQKARMEQLVQNLVAAFRQGIDNLEWMSPATRTQAKDKLNKFTVKIGYPDKWRDYSAIQIQPGDLVGNLRRAGDAEYARMIGRLGKPVDRAEWGMTPQTVNAYYNPVNNEIVFPAAILQPPFFNAEADDAVNYGAIGAVIGHEISHGFDDQGRKSDGEGNLRDWWSTEDAAAFETRANALVAQYGGFSPLEGANVNGRLTLGENIGDLSGLAVAYRAYKLSLNGREAPVINGFTGDQRFFLGWAQVWRSKYRDEALRQQLMTDPHSPGMYRTNGVLVNMPEFYQAFGVKEGDKMYVPADKRVKIW
jgi:putative endopeptidase